MEMHTGSMHPVTFPATVTTLEQQIEYLFKAMELGKEDEERTWEQNFWESDEFYEKCRRGEIQYALVHGVIYEVKDTHLEEDNCFLADTQPDGSVNYTVFFYNGGCGFEEALEEAIDQERAKGDV
jgi:hypothetical protein